MRKKLTLLLMLSLTACQTTFRSGFSQGLQTPVAQAPVKTSDQHFKEMPDMRWPVTTGRVSQFFVSGDHWGIDIAAPRGTRIYASHSGRVIYSGRGFNGYGKFIILESGNLATFYSHCHKLLVRQGQWVEKGQLIAQVGKTGNATGPHLHFEVRRNRLPIDPLVLLPRH